MEIKKCPNCGASIQHNYNHKCSYCGTQLNMTNDEIKKLENCDIRIEDIDIERNPIRYGFIVTVRGWSTPKFHYLEEFTDNGYIVSGSDIGKRIGYRFEVPMEMIYNEAIHLPEFIYNSIPPQMLNGYNEEKIMDKCMEYFMKIGR